MPCRDGRTNSSLWERAKKAAKEEACRSGSRRCGAWDARIAQRAGKIYRDRGGGYCGKKTQAQKSMSKWTAEEWETATGERACRRVRGKVVCDRYLPKKAWGTLSRSQKAATRRKKKAGQGQFVPNTRAARSAGRRARGLGDIPQVQIPVQKPLSKYTLRWLMRDLGEETRKCKITPAMLKRGILVEREHHMGVKETAKIAIDHLCERRDYYDILEKVGL